MASREPVAIVTSEGGMKCAYSAGALVSLASILRAPDPDIFVAASGSVASMFYYLAGQYDAVQRAWTTFIASKNVIRYFPFPQFDLDYLVNVIFKEFLPLNEARLEASKVKYFVPITDAVTGDTRYITNDTWFDPYEIMRAAKAIPLLSAGSIWLGGHRYVDGGIGTDCASLVQKAVDAGAKRILLISNVSPDWGRLAVPMHWYARLQPKGLRDLMERDLAAIEQVVAPKGIELVHLSPTYPLPVGLITRNKRRVAEAFHMGYDDLEAKREEIEKLFRP